VTPGKAAWVSKASPAMEVAWVRLMAGKQVASVCVVCAHARVRLQKCLHECVAVVVTVWAHACRCVSMAGRWPGPAAARGSVMQAAWQRPALHVCMPCCPTQAQDTNSTHRDVKPSLVRLAALLRPLPSRNLPQESAGGHGHAGRLRGLDRHRWDYLQEAAGGMFLTQVSGGDHLGLGRATAGRGGHKGSGRPRSRGGLGCLLHAHVVPHRHRA